MVVLAVLTEVLALYVPSATGCFTAVISQQPREVVTIITSIL